MKNEIFIAVVIALGIVGAFSAITGLTYSSVQIIKESIGLGVLIVAFDILLVAFCMWAVINGIIKPLKKLNKK